MSRERVWIGPVGWGDKQVHHDDVEYVRADLITAAENEADRLRNVLAFQEDEEMSDETPAYLWDRIDAAEHESARLRSVLADALRENAEKDEAIAKLRAEIDYINNNLSKAYGPTR